MALPQNTAGVALIVEGIQKFVSDLVSANQGMAGTGKAAQAAAKQITDLGVAWNASAKQFQLTQKSVQTGRRDFVSFAEAQKRAMDSAVAAVRKGGAEIAGIKWDAGLKKYILTATQTVVSTKDAENAIRTFARNTGLVYAATTIAAQKMAGAQQQVSQSSQQQAAAALKSASGMQAANQTTVQMAAGLLAATGASQQLIQQLVSMSNATNQAAAIIAHLNVSWDRASATWRDSSNNIISSQEVLKRATQQVAVNFTTLSAAASSSNARLSAAAVGLARAEQNVLVAFKAADKALQNAATATTDVDDANEKAESSTLDYMEALSRLTAAQEEFNRAQQMAAGPSSFTTLVTGVQSIRGNIAAVATGFMSVYKSILMVVGAIGVAKLATAAWHAAVGVIAKAFQALTFPIRAAFDNLRKFFNAVTVIAFGVLIRDTIRGIIRELRDLAAAAGEAVTSFQTLTLRLEIMETRMLRDRDATLAFADATEMGEKRAKGLLTWIKQLSLTAPFDVSVIGRTLSLNMAMGFAETQAKDLTQAILGYTAAMGLGPEIMERITFNLGQMKAAGKVTATEMRDLARGAFFPLTRVLDIAAAKLGLASKDLQQFRKDAAEGKIDVNTFFESFIEMVNKDFPNAVEKFGQTLTGVRQRLVNFFKTIIGLEILGPIGKAIATSMNGVLNVLLSPKVQMAARLYGRILVAGFQQLASVLRVYVLPALSALAKALGFAAPTAESFGQTLANIAFGAAEGFRRLSGLINKVTSYINERFGGAKKNMFQYGADIIKELARGIFAGVKWVIRAINFIARVITGLFETHSPPKILPQLPKWGMDAMNEYLKGFTMADFDMLEGLQDPIEQAMQLLVRTGKLSEKQFGKLFLKISEDIAKVLSGKISPEKLFGDITKATGPFAKFIIELAKRQLELAKATDRVREAEERLERAREREKALRSKLNKQIFEYNQRVREGARQNELKTRLKEINATAVQASKATKQVSIEEQRLELAQKQLELWEEQVKLQERLIQQMIKLTEAQIIEIDMDTSGAEGALGEIEQALEDLGPIDTEGLFPSDEEIQAKVEELFRNARSAVKPLFDALAAEIKPIWDLIFGVPVTLPKSVRGGKTVGFAGGLINAFIDAFNTIKEWWDKNGTTILGWTSFLALAISGITTNLGLMFDNVGKAFGGEAGGWSWALGIIAIILGPLMLLASTIYSISSGLAFASIFATPFIEGMRLIKEAIEGVPKAIESIGGFFKALVEFKITPDQIHLEGVVTAFQTMVSETQKVWTDFWVGVAMVVLAWIGIIEGFITGFTDGVADIMQGMSDEVVEKSIIPDMMQKIYDEVVVKLEETKAKWDEYWKGMADLLVTYVAPKILWLVDGPLTTLKNYMDVSIRNAVNNLVNVIFPTLVSYIEQTLGPALTKFNTNILAPLVSGFNDITTAVGNLIIKLQQLIEKLNKLPDEKIKLIAKQSPSPFAAGLRDSAREMQKLASQALPQLNASLNAVPLAKQPLSAAPVSMAGASSFSNMVNVNMGGVNIMNGMDEATFEAKVLYIVRKGIGM